MKKSLSLLILPALLLSSCSLSDLMFWKKNKKQEEQPADTSGLTIEKVLAAFEKMANATSMTTSTEVTYNGVDTTYIGGSQIPSRDHTEMNYVTETVGKDSKTNMSYTTTSIVKFKDIEEKLEISKEEAIGDIIEYRNEYLTYGYDVNISLDFEKEEVTLERPLESMVTYTFFDEEAGQTFNYDEDGDPEYNIYDEGMGIIDMDDVKEVIEKGTVKGNTIETEMLCKPVTA